MQLEMLKNLIASAKCQNTHAISLLRRICESAAEEASTQDLVTIGECLLTIRLRLNKENILKS